MKDIQDIAYEYLRAFYKDIKNFDKYICDNITYRMFQKKCFIFRDKKRDLIFFIEKCNNEIILYKASKPEMYINKGRMENK